MTSWVQRHPAITGLLAALLLVVCSGLVLSTFLFREAAAIRTEAENWRHNAEGAALEVRMVRDNQAKALAREAEKVNAAEHKVTQAESAMARARKNAANR